MHMGYSLTDLIGDVVQMSYVDYSDKGSVRRYNKLASRAAEYWLGKIPQWSDAELFDFEAQVESENPYVSSYIIQALILEKALPLDKVAQYAQKLKNNILLLKKCDAKTSLELWFDMWKDGLIKSANKFPAD